MSGSQKRLDLFEQMLATPVFKEKNYSVKTMAQEHLGTGVILKAFEALAQGLGYDSQGLFPGLRMKISVQSAELLIISSKLTSPKFATSQTYYGDKGQKFSFQVRRLELLDRGSFPYKTEDYELTIPYARYRLELGEVKTLSVEQWLRAASEQRTLVDAILRQVATRYGIEPGTRLDNFQNLWDLWLTVLAS